jgi:hypothetical protein
VENGEQSEAEKFRPGFCGPPRPPEAVGQMVSNPAFWGFPDTYFNFIKFLFFIYLFLFYFSLLPFKM